MLIKFWDIVIIICVISIIAIYSIDIVDSNNSQQYLKVVAQGKDFLYPLDQDMEKIFSGIIGETKIIILNSEARIIESPCKNKSCIKIGFISKSGHSSACLPNRILITIEGDINNEIDAISH
ncbi:MAG: NusG domain II-containing protein [Spirochaetaceae bacterium]